ncbi:MAG TPA: tRNA (adenosine(37)-N6)-threonylcarbamoyltransferase complex ATPase subunit type 1 TsaE [Elusimicrobia bacterium]|nr:MAG: tRNA (adenosine(37)-N6)-threonylcarbamoyltransferase complex ATPase subunit type 1 TsaE [Elusimicrobia bacterium RIFOXYD2_FULL_34_30]HAM39599.1 tRNA (adenosine(37)-N6)-threonylcarbamoyltransferase complex ATPase subunit type 1 TsaE [Elusimicrobiota bacterium]
MRILISKSTEDTQKIGLNIAKKIKKKDIIFFIGSLGAGKTVLVQSICKGFKVKDFVNSPSFKIVNEYKGRFKIYHIDLYRLNSTKEIEELGLEEYIYGEGIALIEWADKLGKKNLPEKRIEIKIRIKNENERYIKWQRYC